MGGRLGGNGSAFTEIRPVIDNGFPDTEVRLPLSATDQNVEVAIASGTWVTDITGGDIEIKLQARIFSGTKTFSTQWNSISWTVMVFPTQKGNVPAVGAWGLAVMLLSMLTIGSLKIIKREVAI